MNIKRAVLAVTLSVVFSSAAWSAAPSPSTGLGQAWPNATDVSTSPHFHAYLFTRDGIEYVQINDLHGSVRAAFAVAPGTVLMLPIGVDAAQAGTTNDAVSSGTTETVYQDKAVSISATPQSDGSFQFNATPTQSSTCTDPGECGDIVKQVK
jgi:hypothetical protein